MYACAQPCEKEICDFVFEHGKGISHGWAQAVITTRRYVLGDGQSECMFINWKGFMVYIFYIHNVVGGVVNCKSLIYGGGIHRTRRYRCDCEMIQLYEYIIVYKIVRDIFCFHIFFLPRNFSFIKSVIFYSLFPLTRI